MRSTRSVQIGTASSPVPPGKSAVAAMSKWLVKKSGRPLLKTRTWMSGSSLRSTTISCNRITVSGTIRFAGAFENVIGSALVPLLLDDYTVVTYDPRGFGRSTIADRDQDAEPGLLA